MNDLRRELAPISEAAWQAIEREAVRVVKVNLAARRLVDFSGPHGWDLGSVATGRTRPISGAGEGVEGAIRRVQPLVELTAHFELERRELDAVDRGAADPDLRPLVQAAERIAEAENRLAFHGWEEGCVRGMLPASPHGPLHLPDDPVRYPELVVRAVSLLQDAGVAGPYALALGPRSWAGLMTAMDPGGIPVLDRVRRVVDGPVVRAPALDGAAVVSLRGGDFELVVGRDLSIGYEAHTADRVRLYFVESVTHRELGPEAAVPLVHPQVS